MANIKSIIRFIFTIGVFLHCDILEGQKDLPNNINYQALLRDIKGNLLINKAVLIEARIINITSNQNIIERSEIFRDTTNEFGLLNLEIGTGAQIPGQPFKSLTEINWSDSTKYSLIITDAFSFDKIIEIQNQRFSSSPFSFKSNRSNYADSSLFAINSSDWLKSNSGIYRSTGNVGIGVLPSSSSKLKVSGEALGPPFKNGNIMEIASIKAQGGMVIGKLDTIGTSFIQSSKDKSSSRIVLNPEGGGVTVVGDQIGSPFANGNLLSLNHLNTQGSLTFGKIESGNFFIQSASGGGPGILNLNPEGGHVIVPVLEITGGNDIVEFRSSSDKLEPGDVVICDPNDNTKVMKSKERYDPKVIGVVSGAGGINPGISLRQTGKLDGSIPIAIAGTVKVKVVGKIKAGDLLTTSNEPGKAMNARYGRRAFGCIVGKSIDNADINGLVTIIVTQN